MSTRSVRGYRPSGEPAARAFNARNGAYVDRQLWHARGVDEAFIIMQIGDAAMDEVCDQAFVPAITDAGLAARRVDRHNEGDLLKSEVVRFIERSQIIVADLTNERPNCYLEVGYAMGLGKKANLILTARSDHHWSNPEFQRDGPRIHFDLEGYDILFWEASDLPALRAKLAERVRRRRAIVQPGATAAAPLVVDSTWRDVLRTRAQAGITGVERAGYMEVVAQITPPTSVPQPALLGAMREATVATFGWPIGVVLDNRDEYRPRPTVDGIEAEVAIIGTPEMDRTSYDFWKLYRDGRFYTLLSLFEDERRPESLFWDTRTNRVTEALLLLVRLYRRLGASDTDRLSVVVRHAGLGGRSLHVAGQNRAMFHHPTTIEDAVETTVSGTLSEIETELPRFVREIVGPLLIVFDFYAVDDSILDDIANDFVAGKVR